MAHLNQELVRKLATRLGKKPQYVREQISRRASRDGIDSRAAVVLWARDLGIGVARAVRGLEPQVQQQLSTARIATRRQVPGGKAAPGAKPTRKSPPRRVEVFVSHSSKDKALVKSLVALLRTALNLPAAQIVCTSLSGYRLPGGVSTDDELRDIVLGCKSLLGVITKKSLLSAYVLFELGARWGAKRKIIPVVASGVKPGDLRGPLARLNALDCRLPADVYQLVGDIGTQLGMEPEKPGVFEEEVQEVVRESLRQPR